MRRILTMILAVLLLAAFTPNYRANINQSNYPSSAAHNQNPIKRGNFLSPGRGHAHQAVIPFLIRWELENAIEVETQDLILSTDGGATFDLKIAAYLPPEQQQLIWSASPVNVTGRAKLEVVLRLKSGETTTIISDEFSILPAPANASQAAKVAAAGLGINTEPSGMKPAFAGTGACTSATLPTLNYNMNHPTPCTEVYGGEPALAQNPNDPKRFQTVTGTFAQIRSRQVDWGYSGTATTGFLNFGNFTSRFDMTVEIGIDGTVYAVGLGQSFSSSFPDAILIFRSTDGGATFAAGVPIPKPTGVTLVDKPVIVVHPTNAQALTITFQ